MKRPVFLALNLLTGPVFFATQPVQKMPTCPATPPMFASFTYDKKLNLRIAREEGNAVVKLVDEAGNRFYDEILSLSAGIHQNFDVSRLADGTYHLTVAIGKTTFVKTIVIEETPVAERLAFQS